MIFDMNSETLVCGIKGRSLGHGPGLQNAVHFQTKIIVETGRVMALDNERIVITGWSSATRLRTGTLGPFPAIFAQSIHLTSIGDLNRLRNPDNRVYRY